jgi:hypothetical protein
MTLGWELHQCHSLPNVSARPPCRGHCLAPLHETSPRRLAVRKQELDRIGNPGQAAACGCVSLLLLARSRSAEPVGELAHAALGPVHHCAGARSIDRLASGSFPARPARAGRGPGVPPHPGRFP